MFYIYNHKKLKSVDELAVEIESCVIQLLKLNSISLKKGIHRFDSLYRTFTSVLLQSPLPPNSIKLPNHAAKLSVLLKDRYFYNENLTPIKRTITELQKICCYRSSDPCGFIIDTKMIMIQITHTTTRLNITLIEI